VNDFDLATYYPIFLFLAAVLLFAVGTLAVAHLVGPRHKTLVKQMPYESGMDPIGGARHRFDVKFYLIAILFLVFDVELLFLYPWAVMAYRTPDAAPLSSAGRGAWGEAVLPAELRGPVFVVLLVFIATLAVGYIYAWRKGVFEWR
jgi:NADH:ubiquinone oxidoreductase subunit 3 (subunit A)